MSGVLRVVLADDHYLVREGTRRLLEDSGEVEVVAAVGSADELLEAVERLAPDAVVTDIKMPPAEEAPFSADGGPVGAPTGMLRAHVAERAALNAAVTRPTA